MTVAAIETLCASLEATLSDRTKHISIDYAFYRINEISGELPDLCLFVCQKKFFRDESEEYSDLEYLLLNYISFKIESGQLIRFSSLKECYDCHQKNINSTVINEPNIIVCSDDSRYNSLQESVKKIASTINAIYHSFIYDDIVASSSRRLRNTLIRLNENYTVPDLLTYLSLNYEIDGLTLVRYIRNPNSDHIDVVDEKMYGREVSIISENSKKSIEYSATVGKISDGFSQTPDGQILNYVVVPVTDLQWRAIRGDQPAEAIIVFNIGDYVDEFLVRFALEGAKGSAEVDQKSLQLQVLQKLDQAKRRLARHIRNGSLRSEVSRLSFIENCLTEILTDSYKCCKAHSITVRIFNPFTDSLSILAQCVFTSGKYKDDFDGQIYTSNQKSVNVECFQNKGPNEYIYIPDLNYRPDVDNDVEGVATVFNPRISISELCFPIWKSGVPIGTINAESPLRNAFGKDIAFFGSISRLVGDLFATSMDAVPPDAVAQLANVNELAHSTLGDSRELTEIDSLDLPVTIKSTFRAWSQYEEKFRRPLLIERDDSKSIDLRSLLLQVVRDALTPKARKLVDINKILFILDTRINSYEAENIRGILNSVLSNAERHSSISVDYIRVYAIDRGRYRYLFIRYKSIHRMIDCEVASDFGLLPVTQNGTVRYGAFLMGSRVRAAGGTLMVRRPEKDQVGHMPLEFAIGLPLGRA